MRAFIFLKNGCEPTSGKVNIIIKLIVDVELALARDSLVGPAAKPVVHSTEVIATMTSQILQLTQLRTAWCIVRS